MIGDPLPAHHFHCQVDLVLDAAIIIKDIRAGKIYVDIILPIRNQAIDEFDADFMV